MEKVGKADVSTDFYSREEEISDLRRGPWTVEEDFTLINYIAIHGEGRWNSLARSAGLRRTGKSCRLRWLNYLRPDVRRGNITVEEQLLILELHSQWGNRWSKIAQHLPGRTDNEIKNYWRTRVQKHAKHLKCDVNSKQFKETMRYLWMPRLVERIQAAAGSSGDPSPAALSSSFSAATTTTTTSYQVMNSNNMCDLEDQKIVMPAHPPAGVRSCTPENASSDSFGTPVSDLTECYNNCPINQDYYPAANQVTVSGDCYQSSLSGPAAYFDQRTLDFIEQNSQWMDGGDVSEGFWNVDDTWFFQPQGNGLV